MSGITPRSFHRPPKFLDSNSNHCVDQYHQSRAESQRQAQRFHVMNPSNKTGNPVKLGLDSSSFRFSSSPSQSVSISVPPPCYTSLNLDANLEHEQPFIVDDGQDGYGDGEGAGVGAQGANFSTQARALVQDGNWRDQSNYEFRQSQFETQVDDEGGEEGGQTQNYQDRDQVESHDDTQEEDEEECQDQDEDGSVSMHSCCEILPSPYSTEDLFAGLHVHSHPQPRSQPRPRPHPHPSLARHSSHQQQHPRLYPPSQSPLRLHSRHLYLGQGQQQQQVHRQEEQWHPEAGAKVANAQADLVDDHDDHAHDGGGSLSSCLVGTPPPQQSCSVHGYTHTHSRCTAAMESVSSPGSKSSIAGPEVYESHSDPHAHHCVPSHADARGHGHLQLPPSLQPSSLSANWNRSRSRSKSQSQNHTQTYSPPMAIGSYPYTHDETGIITTNTNATTSPNYTSNVTRRTRQLYTPSASISTPHPSRSHSCPHSHPQSPAYFPGVHTHDDIHGHGHNYGDDPPPPISPLPSEDPTLSPMPTFSDPPSFRYQIQGLGSGARSGSRPGSMSRHGVGPQAGTAEHGDPEPPVVSYSHHGHPHDLKPAYELRLDPAPAPPDAYAEYVAHHHTPAMALALAEGIGNGSSITFLPEASVSSHHLSGNGITIGRNTTTTSPSKSRRRHTHSTLSTSRVHVSRGNTVVGHAVTQTSSAQSQTPPPLTAPPPLPPKSRATNYVSLSRKSTTSRPSLAIFRSTPSLSGSSITGEFTIDPSLYIPSALLRVVHASAGPKIRKERERKRKNLVLEAEHGGIDVDVHLVPFSSISSFSPLPSASAWFSTSKVNVDSDAVGTGNNLGRARSHTGGKSRTSFGRRPTDASRLSQAPSLSRSEAHGGLGIGSVDTLAGSGPLGNRRKREYGNGMVEQEPTLIDLRLKQSTLQKGSWGKDFSLIARIHAPGPRPPFHLLASTLNLDTEPSSDKDKALSALPVTPPIVISPSLDHVASANIRGEKGIQHPQPLLTRHPSVAYSPTHLSKSHLTLHIPRNFCGPLTVHVAAGNIDEHVRLSRELASAVVVLSESAFMRGYYVGGLTMEDEMAEEDAGEGEDEEEEDVLNECIIGGGHRTQNRHGHRGPAEQREQQEEFYITDRFKHLSLRNPLNHIVPAGLAVSGDSDTAKDIDVDDAYSSVSADENEDASSENEVWKGDKVDVIVGQGKVHLQFTDEHDPFAKKQFTQGGFWRKLISGYYNR
ncbi:hypothetical protein CPB84DRAFT_1744145 [Gymnopilus junonius]|uniref:DUF7330 domain-containing protein n=1 Tax=Gymnopilus junonius TaxID=109634 RepID=A0A9P5NVT9_GYMJU|nr:hypothetical protein CPB84DRAFT_1744145 [Gymnopilus junonius]